MHKKPVFEMHEISGRLSHPTVGQDFIAKSIHMKVCLGLLSSSQPKLPTLYNTPIRMHL